jgi:hypothetical protein
MGAVEPVERLVYVLRQRMHLLCHVPLGAAAVLELKRRTVACRAA